GQHLRRALRRGLGRSARYQPRRLLQRDAAAGYAEGPRAEQRAQPGAVLSVRRDRQTRPGQLQHRQCRPRPRTRRPRVGVRQPQAYYPRKSTRSMGRVSLLALRATELALQQAGLRNDPEISDGRMGIAYGSAAGSGDPVRVFGHMMETGSMQGVTSTTYIQMMS